MAGRSFLSPQLLAYAGPFGVFVALMMILPRLDLPIRANLAIWLTLCSAAIFLWSRRVLEFRPSQWVLSTLLGVTVFAIWIAPDLLFAGWRSHWLFQNAATGELKTSLPAQALSDTASLAMRVMRASLIVPIVEELFWRGWLMRWLVDPKFEEVPLGTFSQGSFWGVAVMFALEHGPYWDVGLLAGILYGWWMVRTKRLSDLILAHAVTNVCLCAYVLHTGQWEYWL
ncbi:CAAX prenyl protease-related protein [uncultured Paludibaculum sp.]|uniref:CAAX prenyl protease-related protein n=1 Tax=uncultured Paludibaculum sp. TaxID=1765020 RepID=UPI002AAB4E64|nr:CAAX prenyl protease-related protein [uncultured Paludibaculum sp.]